MVGSAQKPAPVKLFLAVMYTDESIREKALNSCKEHYGDIDNQFGPLDVALYTHYYDTEMGTGIKKIYCTFKELINREELASVKTFTNEVEHRFTHDNHRSVNLDPGYLNNDKLVLASTKDFYHRVYLSQGIYAEITLHYRKGRFRYFSWTFPDYRGNEVQAFLEQVRAQLVGALRKGNI